MPPLGAHLSIAGGFYKAVESAAAMGMDCLQLFTCSPSQWLVQPAADRAAAGGDQPGGWRGAKPIEQRQADRFQQALAAARIGHTAVHASYLVNLASPDRTLWRRSVEALLLEFERARQLGIPVVVVHPGSSTSGRPAAGARRVARALNELHRRLPADGPLCLLENTAGQGTSLGWRFEQLAEILDLLRRPERVGVCLDTCHAFAAGYPLAEASSYEATMAEFDRLIGIDRLRVIHVNDSKCPLGGRVDRHAHIGHGQLGRDGFRRLLQDTRLAHVPMVLETPKGTNELGEDWDLVNLRTLRELARSAGSR